MEESNRAAAREIANRYLSKGDALGDSKNSMPKPTVMPRSYHGQI